MNDEIARWEIASRVVSGSARIAIALVPRGTDVGCFCQELADDLAGLSSAAVRLIVAGGARDVEDAVSSGMLGVVNCDSLPASEWRALDRARSRLKPRASLVLVTCLEGAKRLSAEAPGLASWLGGSVYRVAPEDIEQDDVRLARLAGLRKRYNMTDAEAVLSAERGEMPSDPEFAVWLVLLGRGDLAARSGG